MTTDQRASQAQIERVEAAAKALHDYMNADEFDPGTNWGDLALIALTAADAVDPVRVRESALRGALARFVEVDSMALEEAVSSVELLRALGWAIVPESAVGAARSLLDRSANHG